MKVFSGPIPVKFTNICLTKIGMIYIFIFIFSNSILMKIRMNACASFIGLIRQIYGDCKKIIAQKQTWVVIVFQSFVLGAIKVLPDKDGI